LAILSKSTSVRRPRRITWRVFCGSLGILIGLVLYVRWLSLPWAQGMQTSRKVRQQEARLQERRAENARLAQHLVYLKSPEGIESLARSRGYHRPDEQVYLEPHH
jgi:cell division protein FtsB